MPAVQQRTLSLWAIPTVLTALSVAVAIGCGSSKSAAPKNVHQTFEDSDEGWIPFGQDAQVELTHERAQIKDGNSALALHYIFHPGQYGSAVLPVEQGQLSRLSSIQFWIKTDHATPIIVILSEKQPGGYYSTWFWCPRDQWQHVELQPADFALDEGPADPKDPDGRLDLDQVQGIGISDMGQAFQTLGKDSSYPLVIDRAPGPHVLNLDDFDFVMGEASASERGRSRLIGDLDRSVLTWITTGGAELGRSTSQNALNEAALEVNYEQTAGRYVAIVHTLSNLDLHGTSKLSFKVAAKNNSKFILYLEKKRAGSLLGPRYSLLLEVPGDSQAHERQIALADFRVDPAGPSDPDGKLDARALKSISLVDITAIDGRPATKNTFWLSSIRPQ
jgi:hypothetical protein